jgi:hypothetical protein
MCHGEESIFTEALNDPGDTNQGKDVQGASMV